MQYAASTGRSTDRACSPGAAMERKGASAVPTRARRRSAATMGARFAQFVERPLARLQHARGKLARRGAWAAAATTPRRCWPAAGHVRRRRRRHDVPRRRRRGGEKCTSTFTWTAASPGACAPKRRRAWSCGGVQVMWTAASPTARRCAKAAHAGHRLAGRRQQRRAAYRIVVRRALAAEESPLAGRLVHGLVREPPTAGRCSAACSYPATSSSSARHRPAGRPSRSSCAVGSRRSTRASQWTAAGRCAITLSGQDRGGFFSDKMRLDLATQNSRGTKN